MHTYRNYLLWYQNHHFHVLHLSKDKYYITHKSQFINVSIFHSNQLHTRVYLPRPN